MGRFVNNANGVVVSVADHKDDRFGEGWTREGTPAPAVRSDIPDSKWKVAELKAYAKENSVDLGDATKKEDLIAAIELHIEASNS